jgi:diacylglycerol kinase (ATP)
MRTVVFINAHSRRAKQNLLDVKAFFDTPDSKFRVIDFIVVKRLQKLDHYLERLKANSNIECVVIGSGDGTINAVLTALKHRKNITYGFLPLGTGNVFVRSLGLPMDISEAMNVLTTGKRRWISLGEVNGKRFANFAAIGISVRLAGTVSDRTKKYLGEFAYVISTIKELVRHGSFLCEIKYGNKIDTFTTHQLHIANGAYHGYSYVSDQASVYKDQLVITVFGASRQKRTYLASITRFLLGKHEQSDDVITIPVKSATITTSPFRNVEADGEIIGQTPIEIRNVTRAIRVFTL